MHLWGIQGIVGIVRIVPGAQRKCLGIPEVQKPVWSRIFLVFLVLNQPRQHINKCTNTLKHHKELLPVVIFEVQPTGWFGCHLPAAAAAAAVPKYFTAKTWEEKSTFSSALGKFCICGFGVIPHQKWWVGEFLVKMMFLLWQLRVCPRI